LALSPDLGPPPPTHPQRSPSARDASVVLSRRFACGRRCTGTAAVAPLDRDQPRASTGRPPTPPPVGPESAPRVLRPEQRRGIRGRDQGDGAGYHPADRTGAPRRGGTGTGAAAPPLGAARPGPRAMPGGQGPVGRRPVLRSGDVEAHDPPLRGRASCHTSLLPVRPVLVPRDTRQGHPPHQRSRSPKGYGRPRAPAQRPARPALPGSRSTVVCGLSPDGQNAPLLNFRIEIAILFDGLVVRPKGTAAGGRPLYGHGNAA
jgi:hypothetical protein